MSKSYLQSDGRLQRVPDATMNLLRHTGHPVVVICDDVISRQ